MFEAVASRLKTAAKVENCFQSLTLLHKDCLKLLQRLQIVEELTYIVAEFQNCCKKSIIFPEFQKFSLHLREF